MSDLKTCPFCGGNAKLVRKTGSCKTHPVLTITDAWEVECENGCCKTPRFEDCIYHNDDGEVVVEKNGAKESMEFWNGRASD